ncbi:guanine(37)-N1-methyltransferase [Thamnocephalis sphaerospora]|uniref:tRNA (guanine(37)-N1)-methyltransferase n=1 Tax=Thamnocephalis sphaerospora TaxID=78915 RepID=A0A4P9XWT4_9FUNG|nr:guanine(37)-N1-methyltransferase [Thamnocephalis sphaerospora]|eukprot:RKP10764.1 guanine(37)-N1-methyltransferase [Thamnocephalis sphaerospora]
MLSPPVHRSMQVLSRDAFRTTVRLLAVRVPVKHVGPARQKLGNDLFNQPRLRNVVNEQVHSDRKLLLLRDDIRDASELDKLSETSRELINKEGYELAEHQLEIDYDYWSADEILSAILPEGSLVPGAFETIGHIAHMNLREEFLPYKQLIGQVILDKNPRITSVVNKTDSIDTTFRFFKMEVLAGVDDMVAEVRESGCRFRFDFSKVYWNSRLHTEHDRLLSMFRKGQRICDVFAGVGPFAVPAAKRGCEVYANDLNPESYKYMCENAKLNKVKALHTYNLDGRDFIRKAFEDLKQADETAGRPFKPFDHVAMNLPATAIEFVDAFRGVLADKLPAPTESNADLAASPKVMVHCYCFSKSDDPITDVVERTGQVLGEPLLAGTYEVFRVRRVAPHKEMLCVSFRLSDSVAFARQKRKDVGAETNADNTQADNSEVATESETKRPRTESTNE